MKNLAKFFDIFDRHLFMAIRENFFDSVDQKLCILNFMKEGKTFRWHIIDSKSNFFHDSIT